MICSNFMLTYAPLKHLNRIFDYSTEGKATVTTNLGSRGTLASQEKSMIKSAKNSEESPFL